MEVEAQDAQAQADEQAGFNAGFSDEAPKAPEAIPAKVDAEVKEPAKNEPEQKAEAAPVAPTPLTPEEITALRAAAAELSSLRAQLRDANGHIGGLKSRVGELGEELKTAREQKKDEGKPPVLTAVELKRIKERYPELSEDLTADLSEAIAALRKPDAAPVDYGKLVDDKVTQAMEAREHKAALKALRDKHPDVVELKATPHFREWVKSIPDAERDEFINTTTNAALVVKHLDAYKAFRDSATTKAKEKSQERLAAAIPPKGVPTAGKQTLSDDEALRKGFAEGFNS